MAASLRGEEASTSALRRWSCRMRSNSTLNLVGTIGRFFGELRAELSRRLALECFCDCRDVLRSVSATAAGNVDQPAVCKLRQITRHVLRPEIESRFRKRIRQTGVGVSRDGDVRLFREFLEKWIHEIGPERAVESY